MAERFFCPGCRLELSNDVIENLKNGEYVTCPKCDFVLKGELIGLKVKSTNSSIISQLADDSQKKKKRKLMAYYCPHCNSPKSKLTENNLNLLEMGMVVSCKECGEAIKKEQLGL